MVYVSMQHQEQIIEQEISVVVFGCTAVMVAVVGIQPLSTLSCHSLSLFSSSSSA